MSTVYVNGQRVWTPDAQVGSPYTIEGMVSGLQGFAVRSNRTRGWRRRMAQVLAVLIAGPVVLAAIAGVAIGVVLLVASVL